MKYLIWDFDGTLGFREGMWTGTLHALLLNNSITHITKEEIRPLLSKGFPWHSPYTSHDSIFQGRTWWQYMEEYFQKIFLMLHLDQEIATALATQVRAVYMAKEQWFLYDDVISTLEQLVRMDYTNIILSNHIPELSEIVAMLGIEQYFERIYSSATIGYEKPNTKIFEYVVHEMQVHTQDCIMIGDSYDADINGAIGVGMKAILVRKSNDTFYEYYSPNLDNIPSLVQTIVEA